MWVDFLKQNIHLKCLGIIQGFKKKKESPPLFLPPFLPSLTSRINCLNGKICFLGSASVIIDSILDCKFFIIMSQSPLKPA